MDEQAQKNLAAQLRQPTGEGGIKTGNWMNQGNKQMNMETLAVLNASAGDCILEVGMGNGQFVGDILGKHKSIIYKGCDFSEIMVKEAKRINDKWIECGQAAFVHSDVANMPFADNSFNKIFTVNTIYFWENPIVVLNELKRVLRKNGTLIISLRPKRQMINYPFTKFGFTMYSKEEVSQLLKDNGWEVKSIKEIQEPDYEVNGQKVKVEHMIVEAIL